MLVPIRQPLLVPPGAGIRYVEDNDPLLMRNPILIEGSQSEVEDIFRKFWEYRIWHKMTATRSLPEVMAPYSTGSIYDAVQELYRLNEKNPEFVKHVNSITLLYPRALESKITIQLSSCPPCLPVSVGNNPAGASKSIHVRGLAGTKSLAVFQQSLSIEVPNSAVFLCLNNPLKPSWVTVIPKGRQPMQLNMQRSVLNKKEISEGVAWEHIEFWMFSRGIPMYGEPYPNGENRFPDYRAWIKDEEFDVEMTTVPDMGKWTMKSSFRNLEKRISEAAKQPAETRQDVIQDLNRILDNKRNSVQKENIGNTRKPCMLVVSNWSTHELSGDDFWKLSDLSAFEVIMLIEQDETYCVHVHQ